MAKKVKDTDYLFISTYLHSRERDLLTAARMERMIEAPTAEDAAKVLTEIGYGVPLRTRQGGGGCVQGQV